MSAFKISQQVQPLRIDAENQAGLGLATKFQKIWLYQPIDDNPRGRAAIKNIFLLLEIWKMLFSHSVNAQIQQISNRIEVLSKNKSSSSRDTKNDLLRKLKYW